MQCNRAFYVQFYENMARFYTDSELRELFADADSGNSDLEDSEDEYEPVFDNHETGNSESGNSESDSEHEDDRPRHRTW